MTEQTSQRAVGKASLWIKLQTGLLAAVLALLVVLTCVVGVTAGRIEKSFTLVQTDLEALEMGQVNQAVAALTDAANQLAAVDVEGLNETAQALKEAAASLSKVDVETLNGAISSLKDAANTLKELDINSLNNVIQSLNKAVTSLQKVSDTISGIFH